MLKGNVQASKPPYYDTVVSYTYKLHIILLAGFNAIKNFTCVIYAVVQQAQVVHWHMLNAMCRILNQLIMTHL